MLRKHATMAIIEARSPQGEMVPLRKESARANFDHHVPEEGYIHVRSRMISSRCNDNFDEFPAEEIKKAYKTFIGKPVFVNHHNADHRKARGVIIDAVLHEHQNPDGSPDVWVEGLMAIDAVTYPKLAKAILRGDIDKTSMGTDVKFSKCSACGNIAESPSDYCSHIPKMKGKKYFRTTASGRKVGEIIREICYGLKFFENSLLVEEPADPTALFLGVDARGIGKAASREASIPEKDETPHEKIPVVRDVMDADRYHNVSLREDNTGYFVRNPHGRSDSYTSPDAIPDSEISRVRGLSHKAKTAAPREDGSTPPRAKDLPRKDQPSSPPNVDTLRDEDCPVCSNSDFFSGDRCQVCGFILPPDEFTDPDLTKHRDMKLVDPSSVRENGQVADVSEEGAIVDHKDELASPDALSEDGEFEENDGMLECGNCGFQIKGAEPTTDNTEEEPATLAAGDLCPNCEEEDLVPANELEEDLEYEEDEFGEFEEEEEEAPEGDSDDGSEDSKDDGDENPVDDEDDEQKRRNEDTRK